MADDTRMRYLQILAEVWGQVYLFHPAVFSGAVIPTWEQILLAAIPAVERAQNTGELVTCLNELLFNPLHNSLSERWLGQRENWPWQYEPEEAGGMRCVHEGWNEHGGPYIYGRRWVAAGELEDCSTGGWEDSKTSPPQKNPHPSTPPTFRPLTREERLLGLFKTWTILKYFFPLPVSVHDRREDSAEFLAAWIPAIESAESLEAFYRQMNRLAGSLHDGHALAWHPLLASTEEAAPENSAPALKSGPFYWPEAVKHLRKFEGNIAYMTPFSMPDGQTLLEAFELIPPTAGLILDLRGYPKTHFQQALVRCLCRERVVSPRYELPVVFHPDLGRRQWRLIQYTVEPDPTRPVFDKPVVALIYGETQSSAEDFGMYLKNAGRAVFVGAHTPGHAGNAAYIDLPGGGWFSFTGMRVTWPDGRPFQGIGLCPDVEVNPSPGQEQDEILERGLEVLRTLIHNPHE